MLCMKKNKSLIIDIFVTNSKQIEYVVIMNYGNLNGNTEDI